ncbi:hypothetical protein MMC28_007682 [Mycoblastus sanguinarius]|nr:hypothetical protein [Mycoblastus sanguinarius]
MGYNAVGQVVHPEGSMEHTVEQDAVVQVVLPEMFLYFLAQSPRVNPHYEDIRRESEAWLLKHGGFDARMSSFIHRTDISYFCAVVIPDARAETLRTLCDWGNWVSLVAGIDCDSAQADLGA